ncbi:MAG TPA: hypothetical protein VFE46_17515 [Pirellulales bacterium]|jgi:hypothetical protein|nr:hypothetical protein [Pirellulales bacterium]
MKLQFTVRELLLLTLIVALSLGWGLDHFHQASRSDEFEMKMLEAQIESAELSRYIKELREIYAEAKKHGFVMPIPGNAILSGSHEY